MDTTSPMFFDAQLQSYYFILYYGLISWKMFINYSSILPMILECVKEKQSY